MAKDFISDEEMVQLEQNKKNFISDDEMKSLEGGYKIPSLRGLRQASLEALPTAGMLAGGVLGSGFGPVGAAGGAGLGAMAGKSLEQGLKGLFYDQKPESRAEQYKQLGMEGLSGVASEAGGQLITKGLEKGIQALPKLGHALTGVSEQEIKTYAKRADQVKELAKQSDANAMEAADQLRTQYNKDISAKIKSINDEISSILTQSKKEVESKPIIQALESYKSNLDPALWTEQVKQIDDLINRVSTSSQSGKISAAKANEIKQFLQDRASSAYRQGDMFQIGSEAANAAKSGAAKARNLVDQVEPKVTELNASLKKFHDIEENMNANLLKPKSPESALMAAGSGGNVRSERALKELGSMTGTPMLEQAQNLAAMRTFTNPPLMPTDVTGKSAARIGAAVGLGGVMGGPVGAAIGGAMTSPAMLKGVIETGRALAPAAKAITPSAPAREMLYKSLLKKATEEKPKDVKPDNAMIMKKIKGSAYEPILQRALQNGGDQSLAAANYVLMNRDQNYRDLMQREV